MFGLKLQNYFVLQSLVLLPSLLITRINAVPTSSSDFEVFTIDNDFDHIGLTVPAVGTVTNLGIYNLLYWNFVAGDALKKTRRSEPAALDAYGATAAVEKRQIVVAGLEPHSTPNVLYFSLRSLLENGNNYISIDYPGSKIDHFDLYVPNRGSTIYYGCNGLSPESDASIPVSCSITAKGYDKNGKVKATQVLTFKSNGGLSQALTGGTFSNEFTGLAKVTFSADTPPPLVNVEFDNVVTRVYQKKT